MVCRPCSALSTKPCSEPDPPPLFNRPLQGVVPGTTTTAGTGPLEGGAYGTERAPGTGGAYGTEGGAYGTEGAYGERAYGTEGAYGAEGRERREGYETRTVDVPVVQQVGRATGRLEGRVRWAGGCMRPAADMQVAGPPSCGGRI